MIRLQQLDLAFFGHFTNRQFNFGSHDPNGSDFHIVYGANEAGKTTFMEAYLRLLYGFLPRNEPYAFRHGRENLQVSAQLSIHGELRRFQRNPGRKNALVDEQGSALPEAALLSHLGGLGMEDYRKLLCIDDDTIDKGGEEIVNSQGDIGTLLFSAAAGISDLWQVLESVRSEADALYKPRSSKTRLPELKKEYASVVKQIKELDIPAGKFRQYTAALQQARTAEKTAKAAQKTLAKDHRLLSNKHRALPIMAQLNEQQQAVHNVAGYPDTATVTVKHVVEMQKSEHQAKAELTRLGKRRTELTAQLEQLPQENPGVGLGSALDNLSELHNRYIHAELELAGTVAERDALKAEMDALVRQRLNYNADPQSLVVEAGVIQQLQSLLESRKELEKRSTRERAALAQLESSLEEEQQRLSELAKSPPPGEGLAQILDQYQSDVLEAEYQSATEALEQINNQVEQALDDLIVQGRRPDVLPSCKLTLDEAEVLFDNWQSLETQRVAAQGRINDEQQQLDVLLVERDQLQAEETLIDDEQAQQCRRDRDAAWEAHKATLDARTAFEFEPLMIEHDQLMVSRLSRASDVARLRDLHRQIASKQAQIDSTGKTADETKREQQSVVNTLSEAIQGTEATDQLVPKVALRWIRRYHEACALVRNAQRLAVRHQPTLARAQELIEALAPYGVGERQTSFRERLSFVRQMRVSYDDHEKRLQSVQADLAQKQQARSAAQRLLDGMSEELAQAQREWDTLVQRHFPAELDRQQLATSLDTLSTLRECAVKQSGLDQSILKMQLDCEQFRQQLDELMARYQFEDTGSVGGNLKLLQERAAEAQEHVRLKTAVLEELEKLDEERRSSEKVLTDLESERVVLAEDFHSSVPTGDLIQLREAVEKTQHASMLRERFEETRQALYSALDVTSIAEAQEMLAGLDAGELGDQLVEKESEFEITSAECTATTEARTRCEADLATLTGDGQVALLVELRTTLELEMREVALDYIKLSLGHRLAEQAINRYRDKHRSGMLQATEAAFAQLTNGRYATLQTQNDGKQETLLALDSEGIPKRADEMSKGTRFQLYLALRAAAYDQLAEQGTCLPFICDDIFETFDETRTRAACSVMERIGRRGQAIYLTHHRHVVDIAKEVCGDGVRVHEL